MAHDWQSRKSSLKERNFHMYKNEFLSDVKLTIGTEPNQSTFPAHRYVLATGSSVLCDMIFGSQGDEPKDAISITDVEPDIFDSILQWIYCEEIDVSPHIVVQVMQTAKKYKIPHLALKCLEYFKAKLNPKNSCLLLHQCYVHGEHPLMRKCLNFIEDKTVDALESYEFLEIGNGALREILKSDDLSIDENLLFQFVMKWSEAECFRQNLQVNTENQRLVLDDALYLIRFPLMDMKKFAQGPAYEGLLTKEESANIFLQYYNVSAQADSRFSRYKRRPENQSKYISWHECVRSSESYRSGGFATLLGEEHDRRMRENKEYVKSGEWRHNPPERFWLHDELQFRVNNPITLRGLSVYGWHIDGYFNFARVIVTGQDGAKLFEEVAPYECKDGRPTNILFIKPLEIVPETVYKISVALSGLLSYMVNLPRDKLKSHGVQFTFVNQGEDSFIGKILFSKQ